MSTETLVETTIETLETASVEITSEPVLETAPIETPETSMTEDAPVEFVATEPTLEHSEKATPEYVAKTFDIDIDFDTYSVTEKRAESIRALLSNVKSKTWLASLKDWVDAEGQAYYPYGEQTEMGEAPSKRIAWEAEHVLASLEIINDGVDTEIRIDGKKYLSLQKLPKGEELLLSNFNPEFTQKFSELENELHANLKVFLKAKADRQKAFQEKFKK